MAVMTSKGRVTLPVKVRAALGVGAGDKIEFVEIEKGRFVITPASKTSQDAKGEKPARPVLAEDMNAVGDRRSKRSRNRRKS
jgi:antitoxin PrlF